MSIPVEVERLGEVLAEHGTGYLLTTSREGRVKAVTVEPTLLDGALRCSASRGSAGNLADNPAATLLFPPAGGARLHAPGRRDRSCRRRRDRVHAGVGRAAPAGSSRGRSGVVRGRLRQRLRAGRVIRE